MSARGKTGHGPIQMGDVGRVTDGLILETASAPRGVVCEVSFVFCERPRHTRLRIRKPAQKRPVIGTRPSRGRLKWRGSEWCEFGKHMSPCEHVRRGRCAVGRKCCSRSESQWRHSQFRLRGKLRRAFLVRVTSLGIAQHEGQVRNAQVTWWMTRKRAHCAIDGATLRSDVSPKRKGRAKCKPPPWRSKVRRALLRVNDSMPGCSEHPCAWAKEH